MVIVADFGAAHAAEKRFGVVAMDAVAETVRCLMVDPMHREAAVQSVPCTAFVGINLGALGDPGANEVERGDFRGEHARERLAVALADHDHRLCACLTGTTASGDPCGYNAIGWLDVAAEITAIDLGLAAAKDRRRFATKPRPIAELRSVELRRPMTA
jgi:hypothetical protein